MQRPSAPSKTRLKTRLLLALITVSVAACQTNSPIKSTKGSQPKKPTLLTPENLGTREQVAALSPAPSTPVTVASVPPITLPSPQQPPLVLPSADASHVDASTYLAGTVTAPASLLSNNGGGLISNNGSGLISDAAGSIISNNSSGVISDAGGSLISNNGSGYHVLEALVDANLSNAFMYLTNRDEKFFLETATQQIFATTTDATGHYLFPITATNGFPVGKDVVVNALVNDNQRLTGFLVPTAGQNQLKLGLATTLATEFLRGDAYRKGVSLSSYDVGIFKQAVDATEASLTSGVIPTVRQVTRADSTSGNGPIFDLRLNQVEKLRNQYVVAISVTAVGTTALHALSDLWKQLFGARPAAVTTLMGNGGLPKVDTAVPSVEGDHRDGAKLPARAIPVGWPQGIAVGARGDVFVSASSIDTSNGHVRWLKPDGTVSSLWFPTYQLGNPAGLAIEKEPGGDPATSPGMLLMAGNTIDCVLRVPIIDTALRLPDGNARWPMTFVAGEYRPLGASGPDHPVTVDGANSYVPIDSVHPAASAWRLADEGERRYQSTGQPVPQPARFAHLNHPLDVCMDELGDIYIADSQNQRIRMVAGAQAAGKSLFGYRQPIDDNADGVVDRFASGTSNLASGCIYTIAGNPTWDPTRAPDAEGRWFGEYADSDGGPAQEAKLDDPSAVAYYDGYLYVADADNQRVRRISRSTGVIETVAGKPLGAQRNVGTHYYYEGGTAGDGGPASLAQLDKPIGLAIDGKGRLFIMDAGGKRIRMVDLKVASHPITTVAGRVAAPGETLAGLMSDGDALSWVTLPDSRDVAVDPDGNVLYTDFANHLVRKLWRQWE